MMITANIGSNAAIIWASEYEASDNQWIRDDEEYIPSTPSNGDMATPSEAETARARKEYTVRFDRNKGSEDSPAPVREPAGSTILLPDYTGTVDGKVFVGWSTNSNATGKGNYKIPVYPPGSYYSVTGDVRLYATWAETDVDAMFFIRLDGMVPTEPQPHSSSQYSKGFSIPDALSVGRFVTDSNGTGILEELNDVPGKDELQAMWQEYDPVRHDVRWYVAKQENDGWHVDGILLDREKVSLSYNANCPTGEWENMPDGIQVYPDSETGISDVVPVRPGYSFQGWNTKSDGSGSEYLGGDRITVSENTVLYAMWEPSGDTVYEVEYYLENIEQTGTYDLRETKQYKGMTGATVYAGAGASQYPGYEYEENHSGNIEKGTIAGDGSLVLRRYYGLKSYPVTYDYGQNPPQGASALPPKEEYRYGEAVKIAEPASAPGYRFHGWRAEGFESGITAFSMPASPVVIRGSFSESHDPAYRIDLYHQKDGGYRDNPDWTVWLSGTAGSFVSVLPQDYLPEGGYAYDDFAGNVGSGIVAENGGLTLKLYYKQQFSVKYIPGTEGSFPDQSYEKLDYGAATPDFEGIPQGTPNYRFSGWTPQREETVTADRIYTAQWTKAGGNTSGSGGNSGSGGPNFNGGSTPEGGPGVVVIPPENPPLADRPEFGEDAEEPEVWIEDEDVPMGSLPKTGDGKTTAVLLLFFSALGCGLAGIRKRKIR